MPISQSLEKVQYGKVHFYWIIEYKYIFYIIQQYIYKILNKKKMASEKNIT